MNESKHQWVTFHKGRINVKACSCCGELHLPSNSNKACANDGVLKSLIMKAGYRLYGNSSASL